MTTLDEFGTDVNFQPPRVQRYKALPNPNTDGTAGFIGPNPVRGVLTFVKLTRSENQLYDPEAHALADLTLDRADAYGAQLVLAAEVDTGDVYEWSRREWTESVPKKISRGRGDQTFALLDHADCWPDHADALWIDDEVYVSDGWSSASGWTPDLDEYGEDRRYP